MANHRLRRLQCRRFQVNIVGIFGSLNPCRCSASAVLCLRGVSWVSVSWVSSWVSCPHGCQTRLCLTPDRERRCRVIRESMPNDCSITLWLVAMTEQKIFLGQSDYQAFIEALRIVRQRYPFSLYAYVLMSNHFHLLLEVDRFSTARILQSLLTGYVRRFNRSHRRRGHLFEGRYKAIVCDRDSYLLELVRYIHLNPVRAEMVKRAGEWRWSGHREYLGKEKSGLIDSRPVMEEFRTAARYEAFIREGAKVNYRAEWHPGDGAPF